MQVTRSPITSDKSGICPSYGICNDQIEPCQTCRIRVECARARNPGVLSYEDFEDATNTAPDHRLEDFVYFDDPDTNSMPVFSINDFTKLMNFLFHLQPQQMNDLIGRLHRLSYQTITGGRETRQSVHKRCRELAKAHPELQFILLSRKRRA